MSNPNPVRVTVTGAAGQVGYLMAQIKTLSDVHIGDTVTDALRPTAEALPGYKEPKPMVFSGLYPVNNNDFETLREALAKGAEDLKKHWRVEDGVIVNDGQGAYLTTDKDYGDVELKVDFLENEHARLDFREVQNVVDDR